MAEQNDFSAVDPTSTSVFSAVASEADSQPVRRGLKAEEMEAVNSLPYGSALLIAQSGPNSGARFLLDEDRTFAGRHPRSDIFLDDATVSRRHAEFLREGNVFRVRDSGSLNGTYINRERTDVSVLTSGDEVQIGKFRLVFYASKALS